MKDVSKMRVAEIDALIAQATMTEEQLAAYWQEQKVAAAFCRKHPEFKPNELSGNRLDAYVKGMGWAVTIENVERAYENLKAEGSEKGGPRATEGRSAFPNAARPSAWASALHDDACG